MQNKIYGNNVLWNEANMIGKKMILKIPILSLAFLYLDTRLSKRETDKYSNVEQKCMFLKKVLSIHIKTTQEKMYAQWTTSRYTVLKLVNFKNILCGLLRWLSDVEPTSQCGGHRFDPWFRKIPHATEQRSPWATATEACLP